MRNVKSLLMFVLMIGLANTMTAQPYVDIATFNYQTSSSTYKNNEASKNQTQWYAASVLLPKQFQNGNTFLCRITYENIQSAFDGSYHYTSTLSSISAAIGLQWVSKNKNWKTTVMAIPKLASDFEDAIQKRDWQYGALVVSNYQCSDQLQLKAGLYYNREAFGNFFVPLLGVDWKASDRLRLFGMLPSNYKIEYNLVRQKVYSGFSFNAPTRSFHLAKSQNKDYVRMDEINLKFFTDYYAWKNIVINAEVGYPIGKSAVQYHTESDEPSNSNPIYTALKKQPFINFGLAYRLRKD